MITEKIYVSPSLFPCLEVAGSGEKREKVARRLNVET